MRRASLCVGVVAFLLAAFMAAHAETVTDSQSSIYLQGMSPEITLDVKAKLDACKSEHKLSRRAAFAVRTAVVDFDPSKPDTMKALRQKLRALGPGAIPVVDEYLTLQDDRSREEAVFALRCMIGDDEQKKKEDTPIDQLLCALFHRSVFDRSEKVRRSAIIGLRSLAVSKAGRAHEAAMMALGDACRDPDPSVARFAEECFKVAEPAKSISDGK